MKIRFHADADLNEILVRALRRCEPSIDFQTAFTAGIAGMTDVDVLAMAAADGRLLVTHDRKTMPNHFAEFVASRTSPGVIIFSVPIA